VVIIACWFSFVVIMFCLITIYVIVNYSWITEDLLMSSDSRRNNNDVTMPRDDSDTTSEAAVGSALIEEVILLKEMPSPTTKAGSW